MSHKLRRSFLVRVVQTAEQASQPAGNLLSGSRFVVQDLKSGETREFVGWEELRGFIERKWSRQLR